MDTQVGDNNNNNSTRDVARTLTALLPRLTRSLARRGAVDAEDLASQALERAWRAYSDGAIPQGKEVSYLWSAAKSALYNARRAAQSAARAYAHAEEVVRAGLAGSWASSLRRPDEAAHALRVCEAVGVERIQAQIDDTGTDRATRRRLEAILRAVELCAGK